MTKIRPILKWPGGKFRLLGAILPALPPGKRLVEPFVGSGALFMNADYPAFLLCDLNADLIDFYQALSRDGEDFIDECRALFAGRANEREEYFRRRERFNRLERGAERAALFLYFNRHGYNGLIRYNAAGEFNVPFGRYARPYFPEAEMLAFREKTRRARVDFRVADFRETFAKLKKGDVVYADPPYIPLSATANFTGYAGNSFGPAEQEELAALAGRARERGIPVAISNHDSAEARRLYRDAARIEGITVRRFISCNGEKRGMVGELLAVYR